MLGTKRESCIGMSVKPKLGLYFSGLPHCMHWLEHYACVSYKEVLVNATGLNVGFLLYEYLQKYIPWSTFDTNDLIAIIIGHCLFMVGFGLVILFQPSRA